VRRRRTPRPLGAALGLLIDARWGEPPIDPHPVAVFGSTMASVEGHIYDGSRSAGIVHAAIGIGLGAGAGMAADRMVGPELATAGATALAVAGRGLADAAERVAELIDHGDLDGARLAIRTLVGRDASQLDAAELARAAVESVAENTVDAVVAPACWAAWLGAPGVLGYRATNTLDAMVGHRSPRYQEFGWASARADDIANWVPARLTAGLVAAVRPASAADVWRAVRRDAPAHPSPNSGVAEAAFAAALGVRLGGPSRYGDRLEIRPDLGQGPAPAVEDIRRAVLLGADVALALSGALAALGSWQARLAMRRSWVR
jgi:adenosylcobinamide-phosphate synthase